MLEVAQLDEIECAPKETGQRSSKENNPSDSEGLFCCSVSRLACARHRPVGLGEIRAGFAGRGYVLRAAALKNVLRLLGPV